MTTPTPMEHHGCDTCPFWLPDEDKTNGRGRCHKPEPGLSRRRHVDETKDSLARWPVTMKDNFCGGHPAHAAQAHAQFAFYLSQLDETTTGGGA